MKSVEIKNNWPVIECDGVREIVKTFKELRNNGWVFRGQSHHNPLLSPIDRGELVGIERIQKLWLEDQSIREFLKAVKYPSDPVEAKILKTKVSNKIEFSRNRLSILMLMQHYGTPTRLLDWSSDPFVALFFAVTNNLSNQDSEDGEVWCFDEKGYERQEFGPSQWVGHSELLNSFGDFDNNLPMWFDENGPSGNWFIIQDLRDKFHRLEDQRGFFSVTSHFDQDHAVAIQMLFRNSGTHYHRFVIDKSLKSSMRTMLKSQNYFYGSLFADAAGVAHALRKNIFNLEK